MDAMPSLSVAQSSVLRTLFGAAPDSAVRTLERALSEEALGGDAMAEVYDLVAKEAGERRAKKAVFEPLIALCGPAARASHRFPSQTLAALWTGLCSVCPSDTAAAASIAGKIRSAEENPTAAELFDHLCGVAAKGLRQANPAFAAAAAVLAASQSDGPEVFAGYLDLSPIARAALPRLPEWVARMTDEKAAAVRLAYKDAVSLAEDAGPRFVEILFANLPEPWLILRILSAVMDRPAEGYVAVSELAQFAEHILNEIDDKLNSFESFDPAGGRPAGVAAGQAIHVAVTEIAEFESSIELNRTGPWGKRIMQRKHAIAQLAEARLARIDQALDAAIPLQMVKLGRGFRGLPKLTDDPDPAAINYAAGLMAFFDYSRQIAGQAGYGAARAKTAERLEGRVDQYVEDLLDLLRAPPADAVDTADRARRYLEVSADIMDALRDQKAGRIIRRRAAAA
jgi:hypothetical protein